MPHHHDDPHHHHQHSCCSEEIDDECCHGGHHEHHSFADDLLDVADEAWMEILKDKIKERILKTNGAQLDELAKLVAEANEERWTHKLGNETEHQEYHDKINNFFHRKS